MCEYEQFYKYSYCHGQEGSFYSGYDHIIVCMHVCVRVYVYVFAYNLQFTFGE